MSDTPTEPAATPGVWVLWWRPSGRVPWREVKRGTREQCSEWMRRMVQDFDGVDCGDFYTAAEGRHP